MRRVCINQPGGRWQQHTFLFQALLATAVPWFCFCSNLSMTSSMEGRAVMGGWVCRAENPGPGDLTWGAQPRAYLIPTGEQPGVEPHCSTEFSKQTISERWDFTLTWWGRGACE